MTTQAWIMLIVTWSISLGFTARFLFRAMTQSSDEDDEDEDDA
jgi:hypothetical protein